MSEFIAFSISLTEFYNSLRFLNLLSFGDSDISIINFVDVDIETASKCLLSPVLELN